jgi:hypothetical protein
MQEKEPAPTVDILEADTIDDDEYKKFLEVKDKNEQNNKSR